MNLSRPSFDPLLLGIAVLATLLAVGVVADRPAPIDVFQSPPPVLSYAKTVNKTQARVNDTLTYNIIITNTGGPTTETLVVDQLAPEVRWLNVVTAAYGAPFYDPSFKRIAWDDSILANSTLLISWSVVITDIPLNPGQILTNSFIAVSDSTAVATRFVKTMVFTGTPPFTATPLPTKTLTTTPSPPATVSPTLTPTLPPSTTVTLVSSPTPLPTSTSFPTATSGAKPALLPRSGPTGTPISTVSPLATPVSEPAPPWPLHLPETGDKYSLIWGLR